MKLSVVIPAYNEEKDIADAIQDVLKIFPQAEVIVVDDASTDKTREIVETFHNTGWNNVKVMSNSTNMGHGYSVVKGLREASGDMILYIDADRQIELKNLEQLNDFTSDSFDVCSGWRVHRQDKLFRKFISFCLKMTNLVFHRMYIKDANCPFKLYRKESLQYLLQEVPQSYIVPIACLEVLARKHRMRTITIRTPHLPYNGVRKGFLQILNRKAFDFFSSAFWEIVKL